MAGRAAIVITSTFAIAPNLVLLDEPFVSLDPAMAARSWELLLNTWRTRLTVALLVTHDLAEAASLADRILLLTDRSTQVLREIIIPSDARRTSGGYLPSGTMAADASILGST
jgi:NitT/TauT family transport system ATP-binding protein